MNIKRFTLLTMCGLTAISGVLLLNDIPNENYFPRESTLFTQQQKLSSGYFEYMNLIRNNKETGAVSFEEIADAKSHAAKMKKSNKALNITWRFKGPDNVGGRTRALIIDQNDTTHLIAGGVSGGLWESFTSGFRWQPYDTDFKISNVSCIAQAPDGTFYVGTGSSFEGGGDNKGVSSQFVGSGLYRLTGNGNSDLVQDVSASLTYGAEWATINAVAVDPTNSERVFAAMNTGLRISTDGGNNWDNPINNPAYRNEPCQDIEITDDGKVVVSFRDMIYASSDNGLTFTDSTLFSYTTPTDPTVRRTGRIEMAVAPSNTDVMYASIVRPSFPYGPCLVGVYKSIDGGVNWALIPNTPDYFNGGLQCQGVYDNTIAVYPDDPGKLIAGGVSLFQWNQSSIDPAPPEGEWTVIASTSEFRTNGSRNFSYVHADKHALVFHPTNSNKLYIGSDGGVGFSENMNSPFPTYGQYNLGYNVTQFYDIAVGPNDLVTGGTQDNGTQLVGFDFNQGKSAIEVEGADGFDTELFTINPAIGIASIYNGNISRVQGLSKTLGTSNANTANIYSGTLQGLCDNADGGIVAGCSPTFYTTTAAWESFNHTLTKDSVVAKLNVSGTLPPIAEGQSLSYASKNNNWPLLGLLNEDLFPVDTTTNDDAFVLDRVAGLGIAISDTSIAGIDNMTTSSGATITTGRDTVIRGRDTVITAFDTLIVNDFLIVGDSVRRDTTIAMTDTTVTETRVVFTMNMGTITFNYRGKTSEIRNFSYGASQAYENIFHNRNMNGNASLTVSVDTLNGLFGSRSINYNDPEVVFNYEKEFPDIVQSMVALMNVRGRLNRNERNIWITKDVLKGGNVTEPRWFKVAGRDVNGVGGSFPDRTPLSETALTATFSVDGDHLFYGTSQGRVYRVDGLNDIDGSQIPVTASDELLIEDTVVTHRLIGNFGSNQSVTGIAVDPQNADNIIVTLGNYGRVRYVHRSTNATSALSVPNGGVTFTNINGVGANALPNAPVYEAVIDRKDNNKVLIATEIGVFATENAFDNTLIGGDVDVRWTEENTGLGRVPVMSIKQMRFGPEVGAKNEGKIYIGTHGRGVFETDQLVGINDVIPNDSDKASSRPELKVYPNPVTTNMQVELLLNSSDLVNVQLYTIRGKLVKEFTFNNLRTGKNTVNLDLSDLVKGTYIIRSIQNDETGAARFIKQ